eukprot:5525732-Alexandrium_andersonii.AAC.1
MQQLAICNQYATGVGAFHSRKCSIPQGCPWSMCFLTLLMTGWVRLLQHEDQRAVLKMLAGDLMVGTAASAEVSPDVVAEQQANLARLTFDYLAAMGARVSHE